MQLVTRDQLGWPPTQASEMDSALGVKVHWIGGPYSTPDHSHCPDEVNSIRQEHLNDPVQHWVDIAYNFVVCQHGVVYEARGLHKESGANGDQNLNHADYAVCAIQGTNEKASNALKNGLRDAIEYLQSNGAGSEILGHRDGYNTDCPGDELYAWVKAGAVRPGGSTPAPSPQPTPNHPWPGVYASKGSTGDIVRTIQARLQARGWNVGTVDGIAGPIFDRVIRQFQGEKGLTVDGIVGPATWSALWNAPIT